MIRTSPGTRPSTRPGAIPYSLVTDRAEVDGRAVVVLTDDPRRALEDTAVLASFVGGRMIWGPEGAG
jgi:hypothetical protein